MESDEYDSTHKFKIDYVNNEVKNTNFLKILKALNITEEITNESKLLLQQFAYVQK